VAKCSLIFLTLIKEEALVEEGREATSALKALLAACGIPVWADPHPLRERWAGMLAETRELHAGAWLKAVISTAPDAEEARPLHSFCLQLACAAATAMPPLPLGKIGDEPDWTLDALRASGRAFAACMAMQPTFALTRILREVRDALNACGSPVLLRWCVQFVWLPLAHAEVKVARCALGDELARVGKLIQAGSEVDDAFSVQPSATFAELSAWLEGPPRAIPLPGCCAACCVQPNSNALGALYQISKAMGDVHLRRALKSGPCLRPLCRIIAWAGRAQCPWIWKRTALFCAHLEPARARLVDHGKYLSPSMDELCSEASGGLSFDDAGGLSLLFLGKEDDKLSRYPTHTLVQRALQSLAGSAVPVSAPQPSPSAFSPAAAAAAHTSAGAQAAAAEKARSQCPPAAASAAPRRAAAVPSQPAASIAPQKGLAVVDAEARAAAAAAELLAELEEEEQQRQEKSEAAERKKDARGEKRRGKAAAAHAEAVKAAAEQQAAVAEAARAQAAASAARAATKRQAAEQAAAEKAEKDAAAAAASRAAAARKAAAKPLSPPLSPPLPAPAPAPVPAPAARLVLGRPGRCGCGDPGCESRSHAPAPPTPLPPLPPPPPPAHTSELEQLFPWLAMADAAPPPAPPAPHEDEGLCVACLDAPACVQLKGCAELHPPALCAACERVMRQQGDTRCPLCRAPS